MTEADVFTPELATLEKESIPPESYNRIEKSHIVESEKGFAWLNREPLEDPNVDIIEDSFYSNGIAAEFDRDNNIFTIDFIPFNKTEAVETEAAPIVLYKAYLGIKNFVEYIDESGFPDDTQIGGLTNPTMAEIATKFGFQDIKYDDEFSDDVEVYSTLGNLRQALVDMEKREVKGQKTLEGIRKKAIKAYEKHSLMYEPSKEEYLKCAINLDKAIRKSRGKVLECAVYEPPDSEKNNMLNMVIKIPNEDYLRYTNDLTKALIEDDNISPLSYLDDKEARAALLDLLSGKGITSSVSQRINMALDLFTSQIEADQINNYSSVISRVKFILLPENFDEITAEHAVKCHEDTYYLSDVVSNSMPIHDGKIADEADLGYTEEEKKILKQIIHTL